MHKSAQHLFVLVHGLNGNQHDFDFIYTHLHQYYGKNALILKSCVNEGKKTHDGIAECAKRLVHEIKTFLAKHHDGNSPLELAMIGRLLQTIFSHLQSGHSLGGLISRYAVYLMFGDAQYNPSFSFLQPTTFMSIVSPHLGSRRPGGTFGKNVWKTLVGTWVNVGLGKTGVELHMDDECKILKKMTSKPFLDALQRFKHRTLISIPHGDMSVPHAGASIRGHNPYEPPIYNGKCVYRIVGLDGTFPGHIKAEKQFVHKGTEKDPHHGEKNGDIYHCDNARHVEFEKEMLEALQSLNWRRLDVEFVLPPMYKFQTHCMPVRKRSPACVGTQATIEDILACAADFVKQALLPVLYHDHKTSDIQQHP